MAALLITLKRPSKKERNLKKVLSEIELLVNRANYRKEFLEIELQQKLELIFGDPYKFPSHCYNHLKKVLFMITGIEKSSNFGYYFYETLQENPFPFCNEVLKSAVYNEKYYNLNDKALKSYVRVYMIDNNFDSQLVLDFDEIIPEGHGQHYFETFTRLDNLDLSHNFPLRPGFFDMMYTVLNRDIFPMTQKKATTIIGLLNLKQLGNAAIGKSHHLLSQENLTTEQIMVFIHLVKLTSLLKREPLPETITHLINNIITWGYNGGLPGKFTEIKKLFHEHVRMLWDTSLVA